MQAFRRLTILLLLLLVPSHLIRAQEKTPGETNSNIAPNIVMTATSERVRFTAPGAVVRMQIEIYSKAGETLFDVSSKGNVLDWTLADSAGRHVADGAYLCVVTVKMFNGKMSQRLGLVSVAGQQVSIRSTQASELSAAQRQAVGPVEENASLTITPAGDAPSAKVVAHDEKNNQAMIPARTFQSKDVFSGTEQRQMRLTENGNLRIGAAPPEAQGAINRLIRTRSSKFSGGGSALNFSAQGGGFLITLPSGATAVASVVPRAVLTITQNRIPKFTDSSGTLGDSLIYETTTGKIGIGTTTPPHIFSVRQNGGTAGVHTVGELFVDRDNNSRSASLTVGTAGTLKWIFGMPSGGDGFQLYDLTNNVSRFFVDPTNGNAGIGTTSPSYKLDVQGSINSSGGLCIAGDCRAAIWAEHHIAEYASITAALSQIGSTRTTLVIDRNVDIPNNTEFPSTLTIKFVGAGKFTLATNVYAAGFGQFIVENDNQVFSLGTGARFNFVGSSVMTRFNARWWGVDCTYNNTTNSGPALQNAIDAVDKYQVIFFPQHCMMQTQQPIKFNGKYGVALEAENPSSAYTGDSTNQPSITYTGSSTATAIEMINCASCSLHGLGIQTGSADTGVDIDYDNNVTMTGVSVPSGGTTLTYTTRSDLITPTGIGGRNLDIGRQVIVNYGSGMSYTTTLVSANSAANTITVANAAPTAISGATATLYSPYPANVSTSAILDHVRINNNSATQNTNWVGVRVSATSVLNNERVKLTDVIIGGNNGNTATSLDYGAAIAFGDQTIGGGSNTVSLEVLDSYINSVSYGVKSFASLYRATNNEYTWVTTVHKVIGGAASIANDRPEIHRQFLDAFATKATLLDNEIPYGGWNASYPVVKVEETRLTMIGNTYSAQSGITSVDAVGVNSRFMGFNNAWADAAPTFTNFDAGAVDGLNDGSRTFKLGGKNGIAIEMTGQTYGLEGGLPARANGTVLFCKDCVAGTSPCTSGGSGAFAFRVNGAWKCPF